MSIPVVEEVLVVERRLMLKEEIRLPRAWDGKTSGAPNGPQTGSDHHALPVEIPTPGASSAAEET